MASDTNYSDDEIDIRELIRTLFRYKWVILGITLVAAVIVFLFSEIRTAENIYFASPGDHHQTVVFYQPGNADPECAAGTGIQHFERSGLGRRLDMECLHIP